MKNKIIKLQKKLEDKKLVLEKLKSELTFPTMHTQFVNIRLKEKISKVEEEIEKLNLQIKTLQGNQDAQCCST